MEQWRDGVSRRWRNGGVEGWMNGGVERWRSRWWGWYGEGEEWRDGGVLR